MSTLLSSVGLTKEFLESLGFDRVLFLLNGKSRYINRTLETCVSDEEDGKPTMWVINPLENGRYYNYYKRSYIVDSPKSLIAFIIDYKVCKAKDEVALKIKDIQRDLCKITKE